MEALFGILILIMSVVVHEVSHGYAADQLGDPTARLAGRLTLNPVKHLDLFGSILVPLLTFFTGGFIFGWARPVPYNPYNLKGKWGDALVAAAGPVSNLSLALLFGLLVRFGASVLPSAFIQLSLIVVLINIVLMTFNLIPVPPLDGSKILFAFLPHQYDRLRMMLERYGFLIVLLVVLFLWQALSPLISFLFMLITGVGI